MDKEAQEQVIYFLDIAQKIGKAGGYLDVWGNARTLLNQLEELGYRKLPEDKPPLLSDRGINQAYLSNVHGIRRRGSRLNKVAQAQREADIKWYEEA